MLMSIVWLAVGFIMVIKGGDLFVDSSVRIAKHFHVPRALIGGTLVSIATTLPELIVSVTASFMKDSGIALGNTVGSAIANIGLIVGVVAVMTQIKVNVRDFIKSCSWMLALAFLVIIFGWNLEISRIQAGVLLAIGIVYLIYNYMKIARGGDFSAENPEEGGGEEMRVSKAFTLFAVGAAVVIVGSRLLVTSGIVVAEALGIPSVIIGLTVIAVGTSLPELVTAITSARKGVADLSAGNIVGANILNLGLITGLSGAIHPLTITLFTRNYSFFWLAIMVGLMTLFMTRGTAGKKQGLVLVLCYGLYVAGLVILPAMGVQ